MNHQEWPTYAEVQAMAQKAHDDGYLLEMVQEIKGWSWTWRHSASGMTFEGSCDNEHKAIALVCALQAVPLVIISVDATTVEPTTQPTK